MDCEQLDTILDQGLSRAPLPNEAQRHLATCPRCRALHDWLTASPSGDDIPANLRERVRRTIGRVVPPVKPLPPLGASAGRVLMIFCAAVAVMLAVMGTAGLARMTPVQIAGMSALLIAGAALFAVSLARQMRPGSAQRLPAPLILSVFGAGLLIGMALLFPFRDQPAFVATGWPCLAAGLGMAAPSALLLWLTVRRGAWLSLQILGVTLGATAGLLGVTVLQYQCPHQDAWHLLVWHGPVLAVAAGAGLLVARVAMRLLSRA